VPKGDDATGNLEQAFLACVACEPIDTKIRKGLKKGRMAARTGVDLGSIAREAGVITGEELAQWQRKEELRRRVIKVDDFPQDFGRAELAEKTETRMVKAA
jgi:acyl-CoA dehydrogenase